MHAQDKHTVERTLIDACEHVGLSAALTLAQSLAESCECPSDAA